jgi:hypothetical protein
MISEDSHDALGVTEERCCSPNRFAASLPEDDADELDEGNKGQLWAALAQVMSSQSLSHIAIQHLTVTILCRCGG